MLDKYFFGSAIIYIGLGLLISTIEVPGFDTIEPYWWTLGISFLGIVVLTRSKRAVLPGLILILIGLYATADKMFDWTISIWEIFWPLVLITFGLWLIFRKKRLFPKERHVGTNQPNFVNIFSGTKHLVETNDFKGADIEVMFGGTEIDLRRAIVPSGTATLDITVSFGGAVLFVPRDWRIVTDGTPLFGALENKTRQDQLNEHSPTIYIKFFVIFGGIEIKN